MRRQSPTWIRTASLLSILAMSVALAFGQPGAQVNANLTVGDFLLQYARSIHMVLPADATPEVAKAALQAVRALPSEELALDRVLTHADVVRLGRAAGLKITSSTPEKVFGKAETDLFFESFAAILAAHAGLPAPADGTTLRTAANSSNAFEHANLDKGKKKGRPFQSPTDPD